MIPEFFSLGRNQRAEGRAKPLRRLRLLCSSRAEARCEPGPGEFPVAAHRDLSDPQLMSDLFELQPCEEPQLRDPRRPRVSSLQLVQCLIYDEQVVVRTDDADFNLLDRD